MARTELAKSSRFLPLMGCVAVVAIAYAATHQLDATLKRLPVNDIGQARTPVVTLSRGSLYPVWIRQLKPHAPPARSSDFDAAFTPAKPKDDVPPIVDASADLAHELSQQLTLDGITNNGAIINGKFVAQGDKLAQYAAHDLAGQNVAPVLISCSATHAQLRIGAHVITLTLRSHHAMD